MTIKLYGISQSTCTQRVMLTCHELGIYYDLINVDLQSGEHKSPEFLGKHHPFGKVPAIEDGKVELFESRAICAYLVARSGSNKLDVDRKDAVEVGRYEQAASVEYSYFQPAVSTLAYETKFKQMMGKGDPDPAAVEQNLEQLKTTLDYFGTILQSQEYLGAKHFTLVDLYVMPWISLVTGLLHLGELLDSRPAVKAWWERCSTRESWKALSKPQH